MKLIVNMLEKLMPLYISILFNSDLNFFFSISIWFWNAIMSDMEVFYCHFLIFSFYFHFNVV